MPPLTSAQTRALTAAAAGADGQVPRTPRDAWTIAALVRRELVEVSDGGEVTITQAGRAIASVTTSAEAPPAKPAPAPGKLERLEALLRVEEGASLGELQAATGWQAHSVRGALAGALKKQRGLTIISEKVEGVRRYRVAAKAPA